MSAIYMIFVWWVFVRLSAYYFALPCDFLEIISYICIKNT